MAGKQGRKPNTRENRGGARPNSGPKKRTLSQEQINAMLKAAQQKAEEQGKTIDDILLGIIYAEDTAVRDLLAAIKLWKDFSMAKIQEGGQSDQELGPAVYLPESRPDPGKVVPIREEAG